MTNVKSEKLKSGHQRETRTYDSGATKTVTYKPTWHGRDIKSVERREPKKR
jgi:hypothetical protein